MKTLLISAYLLILTVTITAQNGFQFFYGEESVRQEFSCMIEWPAGGYLFGGSTGSVSGKGDDFWLVRTDTLGNQLWSGNYGDHINQELFFIRPLSDGGYLLAGETSTEFNDKSGYLLKLDSSLQMEWDQTLEWGYAGTEIVDAIADGAGNFFVLYNFRKELGVPLAMIYHFSNNGDFIGGVNIPEFNWGIKMSKTDDGHFLVFGDQAIGKEWDDYQGTGFVLKMNKELEPVWVKEHMDGFNQSSMHHVHAIKAIRSGGHVIQSFSSNYDKILTKIDDEGNIIWQKILEGFDIYAKLKFDFGQDNYYFNKGMVNAGGEEIIFTPHDYFNFNGKLNNYYLTEDFKFLLTGLYYGGSNNPAHSWEGLIAQYDSSVFKHGSILLGKEKPIIQKVAVWLSIPLTMVA